MQMGERQEAVQGADEPPQQLPQGEPWRGTQCLPSMPTAVSHGRGTCCLLSLPSISTMVSCVWGTRCLLSVSIVVSRVRHTQSP